VNEGSPLTIENIEITTSLRSFLH